MSKPTRPLSAAALEPMYRIPDSADMDPERKKVLIGAAKIMLGRVQKKGLIPEDQGYGAVVASPKQLFTCFKAFQDDPSIGKDLVVDQRGQPVAPDNGSTTLVCGPTLEQVEKLLVSTCGNKFFGGVPPKGSKRKIDPVYKQLRPYLAFSWQLPLLPIFKEEYNFAHLRYLDRDVMLLRDPESVYQIAGFGPREIDAARNNLGDRFPEMLNANAKALGGVALIKDDIPKTLARIEKAVGYRVWDFFARDKQYVVEVLNISHLDLRAIGPLLVDLSLEALIEATEIPVRILEPLLKAFPEVLGDDTNKLLREPGFCKEFFRPIMTSFRYMEFKDETKEEVDKVVGDAALLKLGANRERINNWMQRQGL
ncbi:hypothetical protein [Magnetospira sp. QH-2]|uniref:hypothetical protein n=1 Tax=Magnetospira sp. (strain QH-2) TaxID=1288970 RepID=UPI0011DE1409|nr:hypothetical protein [Magnetospira sp. QH-2]